MNKANDPLQCEWTLSNLLRVQTEQEDEGRMNLLSLFELRQKVPRVYKDFLWINKANTNDNRKDGQKTWIGTS